MHTPNTIYYMNIKYGTLTEYVYYLEQYNDVLNRHNRDATMRFITDNKRIMNKMRKLQRQILSSGALDPADPHTCAIIGNDLYLPATQNGILFYPNDVKYIHNTIHTDNVYRILPQNPYFAAQSGDYMVEKMIVNYEYFLDKTNPPTCTKRALICAIADLMEFMTATDPNFRKQLAEDRPFIQRWFEKIR